MSKLAVMREIFLDLRWDFEATEGDNVNEILNRIKLSLDVNINDHNFWIYLELDPSAKKV